MKFIILRCFKIQVAGTKPVALNGTFENSHGLRLHFKWVFISLSIVLGQYSAHGFLSILFEIVSFYESSEMKSLHNHEKGAIDQVLLLLLPVLHGIWQDLSLEL